MKKYLFLILLLCSPVWALTQNATVTIDHFTKVPGTQVAVPILVTGFSDIGAITLYFFYDDAVVSYAGHQNDAITGMVVNGFYDEFSGRWKVGINFSTATSVNVPDGTLIEILFNYTGNSADFEFDLAMCEIADDDLNFPQSIPITYTNGSISPMSPEDMTQLIIGDETAAPGSTVSVPVTVRNFTSIGAFDLGISFNTGSLSYTGLANYNAQIDPAQVIVNQSAGTVYVGWNIPATATNGVTLTDDQQLFDLTFTFNGGTSPLVFDLAHNEVTSLIAGEQYEVPVVYTDGSVTGSELLDVTVRLSDVIVAPGQNVMVPVTATGFTKLGAFDFTISYPTDKLVFASIENLHPLLASNGVLIQNQSNGNAFAAWNYSGISADGIAIPDNEKLFDLSFTNASATSPLSFNLLSSEVSKLENDEIMPLAVSYIDGSVTVQEDITLNLKVMLEGLYNTSTGQLNKAKDFVGGVIVDRFAGTVADVIRIELHEAGSYGTPVFAADDVELNQDGTASVNVPGTASGSYYLTVKHRNHLETVSANPVSITGTEVTYDFTTATSQAYGSNQKQLATGVYGLYAGDIDQNGFVNIDDAGPINTGVRQGERGYLIIDIDGSGEININDAGPVNTNIRQGIQKNTPN